MHLCELQLASLNETVEGLFSNGPGTTIAPDEPLCLPSINAATHQIRQLRMELSRLERDVRRLRYE